MARRFSSSLAFRLGTFFLVAVALLAAVGTLRYIRPVPALAASASFSYANQTPKPSVVWPSFGSAAVGAEGYGVLDHSGSEAPRPTASMAKVITALTVLKHSPLGASEAGPTITFTAADAALYGSYLARNGVVVPVRIGQQISLHDALVAMLLPSANNMADTLATWAYGSMQGYTAAANQLVHELGATSTTVSDASGFSPLTTSTASDLVTIGLAALKQPVIKEIVALPSATVPTGGSLLNTNKLLGVQGINGIKTGLTDEAGDCLLSAASFTAPNGETIQVVGVVMGGASRQAVFDSTLSMLASAKQGFTEQTVVRAGDTVGTLTIPWSSDTAGPAVTAEHDIKLLTWGGEAITPTVTLPDARAPLAANGKVGTLEATAHGKTASTGLTLSRAIPNPPALWRLLH